MGIRQKKISVHDLEIGMFVSDLDRPWHQTPFPIQGFPIRSQDEIRSLKAHCKWVIVDVAERRERPELKPGTSAGVQSGNRPARPQRGRNVVQLPPLKVREPVRYENTTPIKKELEAARHLFEDAELAIGNVVKILQRGGWPDLVPIADLTRKMVDSVIRNPDALLWLSQTQKHDEYTYRHSLNTAVWALVCGRQMGLNPSLLNQLGEGCLLSQIGKSELPADVLHNEHDLSAEQFQVYKSYVGHTVSMLATVGVSRAIMGIAQHHRERHNGSGFPEGIKGDRIPLLAKIAGIAEYYETLISPRESGVPLTPAQAVNQLFDMRNIEFQEDLIEQFIQAIGIYPTGTLVELNDGQRGIVVSHSPERRLWPRVMVMTDVQHRPLKSAKVIDLARYNDGRSASETLTIAECLPHGTEGLNPEHYDVTGTESRWRLARLIGR